MNLLHLNLFLWDRRKCSGLERKHGSGLDRNPCGGSPPASSGSSPQSGTELLTIYLRVFSHLPAFDRFYKRKTAHKTVLKPTGTYQN